MHVDLFDYLPHHSRGGRWRCPAHEGKGYNLSVKYNPTRRKWQVKCWSRGCELVDIMGALGLPASAIYDDAGEAQTPETMGKRFPGVVNMEAFRSKLPPQNPCQRDQFYAEGTNELVTQLCNSPRCEDCGPLKVAQLFAGIEGMGLLTILHIGTPERYTQVRDCIRKHRERDGTQYQYLSWAEADDRWLVTNDPGIEGLPTTLGTIRAQLKSLYLMGKAGLRKSWDIASVTLSTFLTRQSVTGKPKGPFHYVINDGHKAQNQLQRAMSNVWNITTGHRLPLTALRDPY